MDGWMERKGLMLIDWIEYLLYLDPSLMIVASSLLTR